MNEEKDAARRYFVSRAIYQFTQRAVAATTLCVSKGPLSPLTDMQSITLRVAHADIVRDAINFGRWLERNRVNPKEPPPLPKKRHRPASQTVIVSPELMATEDPGFDEDKTTEPMDPRRRS